MDSGWKQWRMYAQDAAQLASRKRPGSPLQVSTLLPFQKIRYRNSKIFLAELSDLLRSQEEGWNSEKLWKSQAGSPSLQPGTGCSRSLVMVAPCFSFLKTFSKSSGVFKPTALFQTRTKLSRSSKVSKLATKLNLSVYRIGIDHRGSNKPTMSKQTWPKCLPNHLAHDSHHGCGPWTGFNESWATSPFTVRTATVVWIRSSKRRSLGWVVRWCVPVGTMVVWVWVGPIQVVVWAAAGPVRGFGDQRRSTPSKSNNKPTNQTRPNQPNHNQPNSWVQPTNKPDQTNQTQPTLHTRSLEGRLKLTASKAPADSVRFHSPHAIAAADGHHTFLLPKGASESS